MRQGAEGAVAERETSSGVRRAPDWARLKRMIDAGAVRQGYVLRSTGRPNYNQIGLAINKRSSVQHIIARRHAPGPELLTLLADLFGESRTDWLDAGGIAVDAHTPETPADIAARQVAHAALTYGNTREEMDIAVSIADTFLRQSAAARKKQEAQDGGDDESNEPRRIR